MTSCIWIIIPTFRRESVLIRTLDSLVAQTHTNFKIIVVDDARSAKLRATLTESYPAVHLLCGDGNRWWTGAMNLGLGLALAKAEPADYFLSFNDDVLVGPEYLENMVSAAENSGRGVILGSLAVALNDNSNIVFCGTEIDWLRGKNSARKLLPNQELLDTDSLPGRGTLFPIEVVDRVGFYDDKYFPQYFGDDDYAIRAKKCGFELKIVRGAVVMADTALTGTGRSGSNLREFLRSLRSVRSPNQLSRRQVFGFRHAPGLQYFGYFILDPLRVVLSNFWRIVRGL